MLHKNNPLWGTHLPVLIEALRQTTGPVLELGMGISSTPVLHALCLDAGRRLVSYDHEQIFIDMFKKYRTADHEISLVENWDDIDVSANNWGVVLVDHKPDERRVAEVKRLANNATFLVVHDTEPEHDDIFSYSTIYDLFKYRFDYTKDKTHASVLSNVKEFVWRQ